MTSLKIVEDIDEVVFDDVFATNQVLLHVFCLVVEGDGHGNFGQVLADVLAQQIPQV